MAIKTKVAAQSLVLTMSLGQDSKGKAIFKNLTLKNLKPDATNEAIRQVAESIKTVLPYEVKNTSKGTVTEIFDDSVSA